MKDSVSTRSMGIITGSSLRKTVASGITENSICSLIEEWGEVAEREPVPRAY